MLVILYVHLNLGLKFKRDLNSNLEENGKIQKRELLTLGLRPSLTLPSHQFASHFFPAAQLTFPLSLPKRAACHGPRLFRTHPPFCH